MNTPKWIRFSSLPLLVVALVLSGCDSTQVAPEVDEAVSGPAAPSVVPPQSIDALFASVAEEVDGFGGAFYDADGALSIYVKQPAMAKAAQAALAERLGDLQTRPSDPRHPERKNAGVRVLEAQYDFLELADVRRKADALLSLSSVHALDIDERTNRIRVSVTDAIGTLEATQALEDAGVPMDAVILEEAPRAERMATLRDRIRPVEGGLQINYNAGGSYVCTFGFNAFRNNVRGFVTNSHCTGQMFTVTGINIFQPSGSSYIGFETVDPPLYSGGYRYSDAAFIRLDSGVSSRFGSIARTTGWAFQTGSGSLTINASSPHIEIDSEKTSLVVGEYIDKIGRTTGWTYGDVQSTCQTINMGSYVLYCQDEVYAGVNGGDSGSPTFSWKGDTDGNGLDNADLTGVLWGGRTYPSGKKTFLMSRIQYIETDLGPLNTN